MEKYYYQVYGIQVQSEFEIKAFREVESLNRSEVITKLKLAHVDFSNFQFGHRIVLREHTKDGFLYVLKDTVAFLITENLILVNPLCDDKSIWQSFLIGGAMSVVLTLKNYLVLHGSAIRKEEEAYLFLGHSGAGKSSVATGFSKAGYEIITDDICPVSQVENRLYVNEGTKQVRLLKDAVDALNLKENVLPINHPDKRLKFGYDFKSKAGLHKTEISVVIELVIDDSLESDVEIEEVSAFGKIDLLKRNIYKEDLSKILKGHQQNFKLLVSSANHLKCIRVKRKYSKYKISKLIDTIREHLLN